MDMKKVAEAIERKDADVTKKASTDLASRVLHKLASGDAFLVKIAACCKSGRCKKVEKKKLD